MEKESSLNKTLEATLGSVGIVKKLPDLLAACFTNKKDDRPVKLFLKMKQNMEELILLVTAGLKFEPEP